MMSCMRKGFSVILRIYCLRVFGYNLIMISPLAKKNERLDRLWFEVFALAVAAMMMMGATV